MERAGAPAINPFERTGGYFVEVEFHSPAIHPAQLQTPSLSIQWLHPFHSVHKSFNIQFN